MTRKNSTRRPAGSSPSKSVPKSPTPRETGRFVYGLDHIPIAGAGNPLPCPFCGSSDDVQITIQQGKDGAHNAWAESHCDGCGAQGPFVCQDGEIAGRILMADIAIAAARDWNRRGQP